ncbi:hypothetical protein Pmani_020408 [Petrolisthes manimaculis]|uniref:Uncharacterized protein n=1 Tax=Petrolisthes manimaculis TaxID=1843537 RepID=A0AAE1U4F5_9EUCA|nr:hypothetical protein Pmani_020408 [Petrolisthes manimaculis]
MYKCEEQDNRPGEVRGGGGGGEQQQRRRRRDEADVENVRQEEEEKEDETRTMRRRWKRKKTEEEREKRVRDWTGSKHEAGGAAEDRSPHIDGYLAWGPSQYLHARGRVGKGGVGKEKERLIGTEKS